MFDAGLDQFGPHSRIIWPQGVESSYNYDRGGDIDELRIYDRVLSDDNIASLAKARDPAEHPAGHALACDRTPALAEKSPYKAGSRSGGTATAGTAPTTSPPCCPPRHHRPQSRDPRRLRPQALVVEGHRRHPRDHLARRLQPLHASPAATTTSSSPTGTATPLSGKSVTFYMPNEPWNHLEIEGGAWGNVALLTPGNGDPKAVADPDQEDPSPHARENPLRAARRRRSAPATSFAEPITGEKVRFTNVEQEWPIGEFAAYYVHPGAEPAGIAKLSYTPHRQQSPTDNPSLDAARRPSSTAASPPTSA